MVSQNNTFPGVHFKSVNLRAAETFIYSQYLVVKVTGL